MPPKKRGRKARGKKAAAPIVAEDSFTDENKPEEQVSIDSVTVEDVDSVMAESVNETVDIPIEETPADPVESVTEQVESVTETVESITETVESVTEPASGQSETIEDLNGEAIVPQIDEDIKEENVEDKPSTNEEIEGDIIQGTDVEEIEPEDMEKSQNTSKDDEIIKTGVESDDDIPDDTINTSLQEKSSMNESISKDPTELDFTDDKVFDRYVRQHLICKSQLRREQLNCARMKTIIIYPVELGVMFEEPFKDAIAEAYKYSFSADDRFVRSNTTGVLQLTYHKVSKRNDFHAIMTTWAELSEERFVSSPDCNAANVRNKNEIKISHSEVDEEKELDYVVYVKHLPNTYTEEDLDELVPGSVDISFGFTDDNVQRDYAIMIYSTIEKAKEVEKNNRSLKLEDGTKILVAHYGSLAIPPKVTVPLPNEDRLKVINNYTRLKREHSAITQNSPDMFHDNQAAQFRIEYAMARLKHDAENRVKAGLPAMTLNQVNHKMRGLSNKMSYSPPTRGQRGYNRGARGYENYGSPRFSSPRGGGGGGGSMSQRNEMQYQNFNNRYSQNYGYNQGYQQQQDYNNQNRRGGTGGYQPKRRGGGSGDFRGNFKKGRY